MSESEAEDAGQTFRTDSELNEVMGLFDVPAFARRGQDMEYALRTLHQRCRRHRAEMLDMVHVRLRQWSRAAIGPADSIGVFLAQIDDLWTLAQADEPEWARSAAPPRQRRTIARDLIASVERFNERWRRFVTKLDLEPINLMIVDYNEYYVIEKECVMGSPRLASRNFQPVSLISVASLLSDHPLLPVPEPAGG